ncbi:Uncharacterised protein [Kingella potus]|uniref:Uncharacterized protein n=1 Tax=Kingella potus TaxID=265175 RepID=A0A377R0E5_9NEIS|nr:hypothetical protein [Kingella potus]STR00298.1 Uncharacterised protein [Kingella potus]
MKNGRYRKLKSPLGALLIVLAVFVLLPLLLFWLLMHLNGGFS